jgi:hypothetical protein
MNIVLLMILIAEACLGVCAWLTPNCLRQLAAHLLTRADVVEAAKAESGRRIQFWREELGVVRAPGAPESGPRSAQFPGSCKTELSETSPMLTHCQMSLGASVSV